MIEPIFRFTDEAVSEGTSWTFTARLWKTRPTLVNGQVVAVRVPPIAITGAWVRIYPAHLKDDPTREITAGLEDILNTGRGTIAGATEPVTVLGVTASKPVTRLTLDFTPEDSAIIDDAATVTISPRTTIPGERHVALVVIEYETSRRLTREIVWTIKNLHLVPLDE